MMNMNKTKKCIKCEKYLTEDNFSIRSDGGFRRTVCKTCSNKHKNIVKDLKKQYPPPEEKTYICPICLRGYDECKGMGGRCFPTWVLDHCHDTLTFRGYLCHNCNKGVFRDKIELYERKVKYLKDHRDGLKKQGS
jgi:hypothetical protein